MLDSLTPLIIMSLCLGVAAWLIYMWAVKSGQFDDVEGPKYRMMDDDAPRDVEPKDKDKGKKKGEDEGK